MVDNVLIAPAINRTLLAIQGTQKLVDRTTLNLSTGKDVNSAFDNPNNFFTAQNLSHRSDDLIRLIDGIDRSISVIEETLIAVEALETLLVQAETIALESQKLLELGITDPDIFEFELDETLAPLNQQILGDNPDGYWRLNDGGGPAVNQGAGGAAINGTYTGGVTLGAAPLYDNGADVSANFDGANDIVRIPDSGLINSGNQSLRTVELVFNADDVSAGAGRQVLWEEGGNVNSLNIYIDNGVIYFNVRDQNDFGPATPNPYPVISAPIVAGQTYHAAIVFDFPGSGTVSGYLDGTLVGSGTVTRALSSHTGDVGIGSLNGSSFMHDGASPNNTFRFDGRISDVALYNRALSASEITTHARSLDIVTVIEFRHRQFESVLEQIDMLVNDASFLGQSLLSDSDIVTRFNERGTSELVTEGTDFSTLGLALERNDFNNADDLQGVIDSVRMALAEVRNYGTSLVNDLVIMETRAAFTNNFANTLETGANQLVTADMNEESAKLLASQTRLDLAVSSLAIANVLNASVLNLFAA